MARRGRAGGRWLGRWGRRGRGAGGREGAGGWGGSGGGEGAQGEGWGRHDYLLSNARLGTPVAEFARVFKAQHRVEECLKRAKGEAGLADYQVRTWEGWHHHQVLSLVATWFLTQETRR